MKHFLHGALWTLVVYFVTVSNVHAQADVWADLRTPSGQPPVPNILLERSGNILEGDFTKFRDGDYTFFWHKNNECDRNNGQARIGQTYVFVNRPPNEIYTRERLWREVRTSVERALTHFCPVWRQQVDTMRNGSYTVPLALLFEGVYVASDYTIRVGRPPSDARLPVFVRATYSWYSPFLTSDSWQLEGDVIERFGPNIFGFEGRSRKGSSHAIFNNPNYPPASPVSKKRAETAAALIEDYRDFPKFNFIQALALALPVYQANEAERREKRLAEAERRRRSEEFWSNPRAVLGMLLVGGGSLVEDAQCSSAEFEGRDLWYCDGDKVRR